MEIIAQPTFRKELKRLAKHYPSMKEDFARLLDQLQTEPTSGIDLGSGLRKVRMSISSKGKGKRAGARIITFISQHQDDRINLIYIYDKSERSNISNSDIAKLLKSNGLE